MDNGDVGVFGLLVELAILALFIPIVNIVIFVIVSIDLSKSFGRGTLFGLGLCFLSFIFYPILAFGSDTFLGPAATT